MAKPSVYLEQGRKVYSAKIKVWHEQRGAWVWKKISTGTTNKVDAISIANALMKGSEDAKNGSMTRERAMALVDTIMNLAGIPWATRSITLADYAREYVEAAVNRAKDPLKAKAPVHWKRFAAWAGPKTNWPMEHLEKGHWQEYYADLLKELSERTANDHLATFRQMYGKAVTEGRIRGNPVALVDTESNNSIEKEVITRSDMVLLLKTLRRELMDQPRLRDSWILLSLLGWHFGHRIQDMLSLSAGDIKKLAKVGLVISFETGKKERKGGEKKGRIITLPIPNYMASKLIRLGDLTAIHDADNSNGHVSTEFGRWLERSCVEVGRITRGSRSVAAKSFHSFRHSLTTRLASANIERGLAAKVTDHESAAIQRHYTHAEVKAIKEALVKTRRV